MTLLRYGHLFSSLWVGAVLGFAVVLALDGGLTGQGLFVLFAVQAFPLWMLSGVCLIWPSSGARSDADVFTLKFGGVLVFCAAALVILLLFLLAD